MCNAKAIRVCPDRVSPQLLQGVRGIGFHLPRKFTTTLNQRKVMKPRSLFVALMAAFAFASAQADSLNGRAGVMPAIYDGQLFTINLKEMPDDAATSLDVKNASINIIYESDDLLPGGAPFAPPLAALQGHGLNPLWLAAKISFPTGHTPPHPNSA